MTHNFDQNKMSGRAPMNLDDWRTLRDDSVIRAKGIEGSPIGQYLLRISDFAHQMVRLHEGFCPRDTVHPLLTVSLGGNGRAGLPSHDLHKAAPSVVRGVAVKGA